MNVLRKFIINTLIIIGLAFLLPGVHLDNFGTALLVALLLAILNTFLRPILVILTIPITFITFGLFLLVINAGIIMLADWVIEGFSVSSFWWAVLFAFLMSLAQALFGSENKDS